MSQPALWIHNYASDEGRDLLWHLHGLVTTLDSIMSLSSMSEF